MEQIKKPYRPKADKVEKLAKYYKKATYKPIVSVLFSKGIKLVLLVVLFSSCSANWYMRKAISKDPGLLIARDTVITIDTFAVTDSILIGDTVVLQAIDTFIMTQDRVRTMVIRQHDTFKILTYVDPDTVKMKITKTITLPPQIKYIPRPPWQRGLAWGLIAMIAIILFSIIKRFIWKR